MRKITLLFVLFFCILSVQVFAAERTPLRVAQFPLLVQSRMDPAQNVRDNLEKRIDRSLHVPLNSTLNAVFYIPEKECLAAFEEAEQEAVGKRKLKELMRPVAEKLQADLVVLPVLTGYEQYETMSWYRWGRHITHSYAAVEIMGYDKAKDEVFSKGATRQFHDEYSTQADVSLLAYEAMDEALQRAKIHERIWTWRER